MDNLRFSSAPTADSIDASIAQHYPACEPVAVLGYACHFPESPDGEAVYKRQGFGTFHFVVTHITIIVITEASGVVCISALHLCIDNDLKSFIGRGGVASLEGVSR